MAGQIGFQMFGEHISIRVLLVYFMFDFMFEQNTYLFAGLWCLFMVHHLLLGFHHLSLVAFSLRWLLPVKFHHQVANHIWSICCIETPGTLHEERHVQAQGWWIWHKTQPVPKTGCSHGMAWYASIHDGYGTSISGLMDISQLSWWDFKGRKRGSHYWGIKPVLKPPRTDSLKNNKTWLTFPRPAM